MTDDAILPWPTISAVSTANPFQYRKPILWTPYRICGEFAGFKDREQHISSRTFLVAADGGARTVKINQEFIVYRKSRRILAMPTLVGALLYCSRYQV